MQKLTVEILYEGNVQMTPENVFTAFQYSIWKIASVTPVENSDKLSTIIVCPACLHAFELDKKQHETN